MAEVATERRRLISISGRHRIVGCACGHAEHIVKGLRADRIICPRCDELAAQSGLVFGFMSAMEFRGHTLNVESVVAFNGTPHRIKSITDIKKLQGRIATGILRLGMQPLPVTAKASHEIAAPFVDQPERKRRRSWRL